MPGTARLRSKDYLHKRDKNKESGAVATPCSTAVVVSNVLRPTREGRPTREPARAAESGIPQEVHAGRPRGADEGRVFSHFANMERFKDSTNKQGHQQGDQSQGMRRGGDQSEVLQGDGARDEPPTPSDQVRVRVQRARKCQRWPRSNT